MTGSELKRWALKNGLRCEHIAVRLGVRGQTVDRWYLRKQIPQPTLLALSAAFADFPYQPETQDLQSSRATKQTVAN